MLYKKGAPKVGPFSSRMNAQGEMVEKPKANLDGAPPNL
jgi:hypothetical protein